MSDRSLLRQRLWRWHFIAGLVVCPFAILLSITGAIYLFKPQVESFGENAINRLAPVVEQGTLPIPLDKQIENLLADNPGTSLKRIILDKPGDRTLEVELFNSQGVSTLFWVDTLSGQVLSSVQSQQQFMYWVKKLHSELLLGSAGSYVVELMASWLIILVFSGLYLWLSKSESRKKHAELVVPSTAGKTRVKRWQNLHSVAGFWFAIPIVVLLLTGLPWTQLWGSGFDRVKAFAGISGPGQVWFVTLKSQNPNAVVADIPQSSLWEISETNHEHHHHHHGELVAAKSSSLNLQMLNQIRSRAEVVQLVHPVQIAPPKPDNGVWTVRSMNPQRSLRETIHFDQHSGKQLMRIGFEDHHPLERFVSHGVSLHEGALFGWFNQLLGLLTALAVICISCFGLYSWWLRKPADATKVKTDDARKFSPGWFCLIVIFGLLLPAAGISFLLIFLYEWLSSRLAVQK